MPLDFQSEVPPRAIGRAKRPLHQYVESVGLVVSRDALRAALRVVSDSCVITSGDRSRIRQYVNQYKREEQDLGCKKIIDDANRETEEKTRKDWVEDATVKVWTDNGVDLTPYIDSNSVNVHSISYDRYGLGL